MILKVSGKITFRDNSGTYFLSLSPFFSFQIETIQEYQIGSSVDLWLYMSAKEGEGRIDLKFFAFENHSYIEAFNLLINISGVGPKMAFNILKNISDAQLKQIVIKGDFKELKKIPGVGEKLAKRIVLELSRTFGSDENLMTKLSQKDLNRDQTEVLKTLLAMGFEQQDIIAIMNESPIDISKAELLKQVLVKLTANG